MRNGKKIGVSLSGGGYRATVYHLGTLKKLRELDILKDIDIISTNSGGSITGATYGLYGNDFDTFENKIINGVQQSVIRGIISSWQFMLVVLYSLIWISTVVYLLSTSHEWASIVLLILGIVVFLNFQFYLLPISKLNERMYNKIFFNGKELSEMTSPVKLAINATNLETGRLFTFSNNSMGDSFYNYPKKGSTIKFTSNKFPIARAVAASTCVPFAFTPIKITKEFYNNPADLARANPRLVDGGVYDNQVAHKITQTNSNYGSDVVIISDAGTSFSYQHSYRNTFTMLVRTSEIFMNRIKNLQMIQYLYQNHKIDQREIAYQSLSWEIDHSITQFVEGLKKRVIMPHVVQAHEIPEIDMTQKNWDNITEHLKKRIHYNEIVKDANSKEELTIARSVKTGLSPLKTTEINALMNHAAVLTEIQVKLYCPSLF